MDGLATSRIPLWFLLLAEVPNQPLTRANSRSTCDKVRSFESWKEDARVAKGFEPSSLNSYLKPRSFSPFPQPWCCFEIPGIRLSKYSPYVEPDLHVLELGCDGVFEWGESGAEGIKSLFLFH